MTPSPARPLSILLAGDLILDVPEPDHWLSGIAPAVRQADIAIGHLEVPHTRATAALEGDVPAPGADPANLAALARAGFDVVTLGGNHITDCGAQGIADTISELDRLGIAHCGAGADLATARAPAIVASAGRRLAVLSYNCVGPENGWAANGRAGAAYLPLETRDGSSARPTAPFEAMAPTAREMLATDIAMARQRAELVIVALHKGIVHTPAVLAPYERPLAHAAIDAGADAVAGHHAHIVKGIEHYRGRPIFHGLGNGCVVTHALSPGQDHSARAAWVEKRKALFGFEPDPAYSLAPFHPEAVNAMLGRLLWHANGAVEAGFLPVDVEPPGRPRLADAPRATEIATYIAQISARAGLPQLTLRRRGDMVLAA